MEPVGYKINLLSKLFFETIKAKIISNGINVTQFNIVKFLDCCQDKEVTQKDICNYLRMKAPSISITLSNMENDGLIKKIKAKKDSRRTLISLTSEGQKLCETCRNVFKEVDELMESTLNESELSFFHECIEKLKSKLEEVKNNA